MQPKYRKACGVADPGLIEISHRLRAGESF
jgi:hypothetical protein